MTRFIILALSLGGGFEVGGDTRSTSQQPQADSNVVWQTRDMVEKSGDKTFTATGTKAGERLAIRVWDHWQLPDKVSCTVDELEVVRAPPEQ